ncbi:hypothetical protein Dimus_025237, partial [Dionaea muscipula]
MMKRKMKKAGSSSKSCIWLHLRNLQRITCNMTPLYGFRSLYSLVLAWGIGVLMFLYLPIKRYVLEKDISSHELFVTPMEIVYK